MKILCDTQYSKTWWSLRRGKPTSSNAAKIVTPAKMKYSAQATGYINQLVGELYDAQYPRTNGFESEAMKNGTEQEDAARKWFELDMDMKVKEVGLCCDDEETLWGSPDGMVETGEPLEVKCPTAAVHVGYLLDGGLPSAYIGQLNAHMLVAGTKTAWFVSYCDGFDALIIHVQASDYLNELRAGMARFHKEYKQVLDRVIGIQGPPPEPAEIVEVEADIVI